MKAQRCLVCGSETIFPWLGGAIGSLFHCTSCHYAGPAVIESDSTQSPVEPFMSSEAFVRHGTFWSETGIGNRAMFQS